MIDLDLFARIIEQAAPLTEQVCFHLMGEPLVHPKLEAMVEICNRARVPIFFVSNGVLLNDKRSEILLDPAFRQVNFSLHSFHDNFPDRDPTQYLDKIFAFTEAAFEKRPDLYINFRLWNLQDVAGSGPQNRDLLARIEKHFGVELNLDLNVTVQKSRKVKNRLYLHFDTEFIWPSIDLPVLGTKGTCHGLSSHIGILVDGTVVPCCLDKEGNIPLGNIADQNLTDILSSERAVSILEGFRQRKLKESLCQRCQYITRFD
jgi:radical SAM protein with 4Fe4S-binding SPASM domain